MGIEENLRRRAPTLANGWPIPRDWHMAAFIPFLIVFWYFALRGGGPLLPLEMFNLMLHEGGHTLFTPFGIVAHFLGGSILQCVPPIVCGVIFFRQKRAMSLALCGVWLGQNLLNIAVYQADAKARLLHLVGGGVHDWHWLFSYYGLLDSCKTIAGATTAAAWLVMLTSAGWYVRHWAVHRAGMGKKNAIAGRQTKKRPPGR